MICLGATPIVLVVATAVITECYDLHYSPLQLPQHVSVLLQHHLRRGPAGWQEAVPGEDGGLCLGLGLGMLGHLCGLGGPRQGQEGVEARRDLPVVGGGGRGEGDAALQGGADGPQEGGVGAGHVGKRRDRCHALWWSTRSREKYC